MHERLTFFGVSLTCFGVFLAAGSYLLLNNIPLTALGVGAVILGLAVLSTPMHPMPKEVVSSFIKSSCENLEVLLEATGAVKKAIYIPSAERAYAYIPLSTEPTFKLEQVTKSFGSFLVKAGKSLGLLIIPPASELVNMSATQEGERRFDDLIGNVLVDLSEVAEGVKVVESSSEIVVEVDRPRVDVGLPRFKVVMGSLPSSIVAQAAAVAFSRPVQILDERIEKSRILLRLKVLDWTSTPYT
ncbi:MAG: hypothetical protein QXJ17_02815 [Nitrososphaeria archaeon]